MNPQRSFYRKIGYLVAMVPVLLLLHWISAPSTPKTETNEGTSGGFLAQLRDDYKLSEVELGEIDPTSETVKLGGPRPLYQGRPVQDEGRLDRPFGHASAAHEGDAPLRRRVAIPGLEPLLQRFRRVRRLSQTL
jgi:hypothetical protein